MKDIVEELLRCIRTVDLQTETAPEDLELKRWRRVGSGENRAQPRYHRLLALIPPIALDVPRGPGH
jgi:hypothetical protein